MARMVSREIVGQGLPLPTMAGEAPTLQCLFSLFRIIRIIRGCEEAWWLDPDGPTAFQKISREIVAGLKREFRFRR